MILFIYGQTHENQILASISLSSLICSKTIPNMSHSEAGSEDWEGQIDLTPLRSREMLLSRYATFEKYHNKF